MDWNLPIADDLKYNSNKSSSEINLANSGINNKGLSENTPKHFTQSEESFESQNISPPTQNASISYETPSYTNYSAAGANPSAAGDFPSNNFPPDNFSPNTFPPNNFPANTFPSNNFSPNNFPTNTFPASNFSPNTFPTNTFFGPISQKTNNKTIAIVGSTGGIGTTLFSICFALYLSQFHKTILIDSVAGGTGLDITLGLENKTGLRMCDLVNADGQIPAERLYEQSIEYQKLKILSSNYTNPIFPTDAIFANIVKQLKNVTDYTIIDTPRDKLTNSEFVKTLDSLIIVTPNNIQGISAASSICNLTKDIKKNLLVGKLHSFKNIKLFTNAEIANFLDAKILGFLKIDSYIKSSLQSGYPIQLKKSSDIYQLIEDIIKII
ncbi:MAG: hypothetical protein LBT91_02425 [Bifidobacteriaceae bacterium]|jgi:MinD-like ATPase involved in chromosome partitioning or flagellar assembly|nr:hypothetical protein [Bifidobacteriaceae bacterium]